MRPTLKLRKKRSVHLVIAVIMLAVPASAVALTTANVPAGAAPDNPPTIQLRVTPRRVSFNHRVTVSGHAPRADAGRTVVLQTAVRSTASWRALTTTRIGSAGGFRLHAALKRSGLIRVVDAGASSHPVTAVAAGAPALPATRPSRVTVAAQFRVTSRALNVLGGQAVAIAGRLLPAVAHRAVRLQGHFAGGWRTVTTARTGSAGGFRLRGQLASGVLRRLRVRFAGDDTNAGSTRPAGQVTVYDQSVASWYDDGGSTACGFHAGLGVANVSLPCGTKVRFRYAGRSVTAVVDDRGPYVGGREWDLNQNTAAALGFSGVDTVWTAR